MVIRFSYGFLSLVPRPLPSFSSLAVLQASKSWGVNSWGVNVQGYGCVPDDSRVIL